MSLLSFRVFKGTRPTDAPWRIELENRYGGSLVIGEGAASVALQRLDYIISDAQEAKYIIQNQEIKDKGNQTHLPAGSPQLAKYEG